MHLRTALFSLFLGLLTAYFFGSIFFPTIFAAVFYLILTRYSAQHAALYAASKKFLIGWCVFFFCVWLMLIGLPWLGLLSPMSLPLQVFDRGLSSVFVGSRDLWMFLHLFYAIAFCAGIFLMTLHDAKDGKFPRRSVYGLLVSYFLICVLGSLMMWLILLFFGMMGLLSSRVFFEIAFFGFIFGTGLFLCAMAVSLISWIARWMVARFVV